MAVSSNVRIERSRLGTITRIGVGGQGVVHAAPALRMQYASALVYKEYKPQVISGLDVAVLESMPAYLETLQFSDGMELLSMSAWPCRLVEDGGAVRGFVMPAIPSEFFLDIKKASGIQRSTGEFQHLLNGESFLFRRQIPLTDRHRYELLADTARGLAVFHRHGIAVGDLSPKNLLFSLTPHTKVFFIDCDAMRFRGRSVVPQLETPGWEVRTANPGEELGTAASDSYKLALLALRLFASDQSTRDPNRLPSSVPKTIRDLVGEGLSRLPSARPAPDAWVQPLLTAASSASTAPPKARQPMAPPAFAPARPAPRRPVPPTTARAPIVATPTHRPTAAPSPVSYIPPTGWWRRRSGAVKFATVAAAVAVVVAGAAAFLGAGGSGD
jgi:serine/threonine protein kinase